MEKTVRQNAIQAIIQQRRVQSQADLVAQLRKSGICSTQASVSRDIRELGLAKVGGRYVAAGGSSGGAHVDSFDELITSVDPVGANLIVIKTRSGAANAVAERIDVGCDAHIAGTVAGDNTIMVAVRSRSAQGRVLAALRRTSP
jgi:transcriptional regulator of arginine metabolism